MARTGRSWGRYPVTREVVIPLSDRGAPLPTGGKLMLPIGNARSYGDSCLNDDGILLAARGLDHFIAFDPVTGVLTCEAGVLFSEILDLAVPQGWFLPVTPGTRFVTVGGAIANDVHGKNHHRAGTFGHHVLAFELVRTDGTRMRCAPDEHPDWFRATIGGLGLTGVITWASIQLRRVQGPWMSAESHKFGNLDGFFALSAASDRDYEYTVAWIDCVARGKALGRGLFSRANHAPARPDRRPGAPARTLSMPVTPPLSLINSLSLRAFNQLYFHKQRKPVTHATSHYQPFFYPLDGIAHWNRMYGPKGFLQYQCVVPPIGADEAVRDLIKAIADSGTGSFLAVLKQFGDRTSPGMLSFARPGATLALDFPFQGTATLRLLDRLDEITVAAGGAVYPAKDARMSGDNFRRYFPAHEAFAAYIDPGLSSSFWRRVQA
ncbi:FAD-binding oxidoreductase [Luteibacter aegosomatissinici]|uniref:FAD-binding oxidoreductase n=1 Tax=Luteibacter aegosomatissinici TaxID=2911539 RepID=UPI001FFC1A93|nr:FAD-binding oxidoreductase [Luteibacter aegosomatissinici]UPG95361.1 FAD-binding oxidoreductase [Luteibacter aegosomatissinici]